MNTRPKPTWITLFSLCAVCVAAFFFIVPLVRSEPIVEAIFIFLIAVALFDVVALWIMANREALGMEEIKRDNRPYRYYAAHQPMTAKHKQHTEKTPNTESDDQKDA